VPGCETKTRLPGITLDCPLPDPVVAYACSDPASGSVDHRNLVLEHHLSLVCAWVVYTGPPEIKDRPLKLVSRKMFAHNHDAFFARVVSKLIFRFDCFDLCNPTR
jgi:hypothetical protein